MIATVKNTRCWDVSRTASLAEVSSWCLEKRGVNRLIVAARPTLDMNDRRDFDPRIETSVTAIFAGAVIRAVYATAWPGTELIGHTGKVYIVAFDAKVLQRMTAAQEYMCGWKQSNDPPLPEDICLYRQGEPWPVLVSVTHDGDAWLFDDEPRVDFASVPGIELPRDLIPPPPDFVNEAL